MKNKKILIGLTLLIVAILIGVGIKKNVQNFDKRMAIEKETMRQQMRENYLKGKVEKIEQGNLIISIDTISYYDTLRTNAFVHTYQFRRDTAHRLMEIVSTPEENKGIKKGDIAEKIVGKETLKIGNKKIVLF